MTIAIDFDGVMHGYSRGWQGGKIYDPPMPGTAEAVRTIMEVEAVFVFTARDDLHAVVDWIQRQLSIPAIADSPVSTRTFWNDKDLLLVTNRKYPARKYLDDRGVTFGEGGWGQALADMELDISEKIHTYLVTVKLPKNPRHDPRNKRVAACPANKGPGRAAVCTDHTGEHHTILVRSARSSETVSLWAREKYGHVTRIEYADDPIILD